MRKRIMVLMLTIIMVLSSVLTVTAATDEWEDDWVDAQASASGYGSCTEGGADAETSCYPSGTTFSTSSYVSATFTYMIDGTGEFVSVSDSDSDSTSSNSFASVEFDAPSGCVGVYIRYSYSASYSAYTHGVPYDDSCSGSGEAWAEH